MTDPSIVLRETDARFWAQVGLKPGYKLDPNNPTDKAYEHVWKDIYSKVKADADAGRLVTTFDHPEVAQNLADAAVAHKAAGAHGDMAANAPDAATARDNIAAATTAQQIATQKTREAASKQPPTVSPQLVQAASKEVAKNPPPPQAPASEHIAHVHARDHAHRHAREVHAQARTPSSGAPSLATLFRETDIRFWQSTNYKRGQKLDRSIPKDVEMAKIWDQIFHQVQSEAAAGTLVLTSPEGAPSSGPGVILPPSAGPSIEMPPPPPPMAPPQQAGPMQPMPPPQQARPMQPMPPAGWTQPRPPMWPMPRMPMPPMQPGMQMPPSFGQPSMGPSPRQGPQGADHHRPRHHPRDHQRGEGPQQPGPPPPGTPPGSMAGPSMPGPNGAPPPGSTEGGPPGTPPGAPPDGSSPPPSEGGSSGISGGTIALIVLGVAVGGTLIYAGAKHKSGSSSSGTRARTPKVIVATSMVPSGAQLPSPRAARP